MDTEGQDGAPLFVGDDLALDFINTRYGTGDKARDVFDSDAAVVAWLRQAGALEDGNAVQEKGILHAARALRDNALALVEARKAGGWADPAGLNRVLALGSHHVELRWERGSDPVAVERRSGADPAVLLLPVAQALVRLLSTADVGLVRRCEADDCTLWFHDRTKSHRRRWCSMALCGNRMKVAAYRARQRT